MYLIDTNVISEIRKDKRANRGVQFFWRTVTETGVGVYLPVQVMGELRAGVENLKNRGENRQAKQLEKWLAQICEQYGEHILGFDVECAQVWGKLMSPNNQHSIDKQIAAIALIYDLTVVTRNVNDFTGTGVRLENPFVLN